MNKRVNRFKDLAIKLALETAEEAEKAVADHIEILPADEKFVMSRYYGFSGKAPLLSDSQIAEHMDEERDVVTGIRTEAIRRLANLVRDEGKHGNVISREA